MTTIILPKTRLGFKVFNPADMAINSKALGLAEALTYFPMKRGTEVISGYWLYMVLQTFIGGIAMREEAKIEFDTYDITADSIAGLPYENLPKLAIDDPLQPQLTDLFEHKATNIDNTDYLYALAESSRQEIARLRRDVMELKKAQETNKIYWHIVDGHRKTITDILKTMTQWITHERDWFV